MGKIRQNDDTKLVSTQKQIKICTKLITHFCEVCAHLFENRCYNVYRKTPNTLYSFCYTPLEKYLLPKKAADHQVTAFFRWIKVKIPYFFMEISLEIRG